LGDFAAIEEAGRSLLGRSITALVIAQLLARPPLRSSAQFFPWRVWVPFLCLGEVCLNQLLEGLGAHRCNLFVCVSLALLTAVFLGNPFSLDRLFIAARNISMSIGSPPACCMRRNSVSFRQPCVAVGKIVAGTD
jgi:hypothetical protein